MRALVVSGLVFAVSWFCETISNPFQFVLRCIGDKLISARVKKNGFVDFLRVYSSFSLVGISFYESSSEPFPCEFPEYRGIADKEKKSQYNTGVISIYQNMINLSLLIFGYTRFIAYFSVCFLRCYLLFLLLMFLISLRRSFA